MTNLSQSPSRYSLRSQNASRYMYNPLTSNTIRLLRLHPSKDDSAPLSCTLFHTPVAKAPAYIALSYAWGSQTSKHVLNVTSPPLGTVTSTKSGSNAALTITPSLFHALQRLRQGEGDVVLWVDAICINQADIPERNVQTSSMRRIYQNAESVAVWLGLEYNESSDALALTREIISCHKNSPDDVAELLRGEEERLRELVRLYRRQYFWRIWVIQEVTCGKKSIVYCGDEEVEWDVLESVCEIFKIHEDVLRQVFYKNMSYVRTLVAGGPKGLQLSRYSPDLSEPPLLELLMSHKGKKATEPRDKVFALVGISSSRDTFGEIDYSRSLRDVFTHTARHIIESTRRLDVICLKQHHKIEFSLPTWAPNWTRAPTKAGVTLVGLHHHEPAFTACGNTVAEVYFGDDKYSMSAKGIILDTITTVGTSFIKKGDPGDPIPPLQAFDNWWDVYKQRFGDTLDLYAKFGRTLSCGNWNHEDDETISGRLDSIISLAEDLLDPDTPMQPNPPSRASTGVVSRSTTMSSTYSLPDDEENIDDEIDPEERERLGTILTTSVMMNRRRLFISNAEYVGLGLWNVEEGDLICVLYGCRFPVVLRKVDTWYVLIGEAYVDGLMNGEALEVAQRPRFGAEEVFEIR